LTLCIRACPPSRALALAEPSADRVDVRLRNHDVEEHDVRLRRLDDLERAVAIRGGDDDAAARCESSLNQARLWVTSSTTRILASPLIGRVDRSAAE
jgi:hypothetical protein